MPGKPSGKCLQEVAVVGAACPGHGTPSLMEGNWTLTGLRLQPQNQPGSNNLKMKNEFPEHRMKEKQFPS